MANDFLIYGREYDLWDNGKYIGSAIWTDDENVGDAFLTENKETGGFNVHIATEWKFKTNTEGK